MYILAASTSTMHGQEYLAYLEDAIVDFFGNARQILFVPFARPGGISHDDYTAKAASVFSRLGFAMRGAHTFDDTQQALNWAEGFFTGGGNTFLLLKTLYDSGYYTAISESVRKGTPYMGTSAGSNVAGLTIGTTNDMPVVYPPSFDAFGWFPFNINPHYLDPLPGSTHMGETREQRISEFHFQNQQPVIGLREGSWILQRNNSIELCGQHSARIFRANQNPYEHNAGTLVL